MSAPPANINARISHLAESETASLKNAPAAAVAAAGRQCAAKELLSGEIPEGQSLEGQTPPPLCCDYIITKHLVPLD